MNSLAGKRCLVTGGASGIGLAISRELAASGADVLIHYHNSEKPAQDLMSELNGKGQKAFIFKADLSEESQIKNMVGKIKIEIDGLDILINNAGDMLKRISFDEMELDFFQTVQSINTDSIMLLCREALPLLKKANEASIVNLSSLAGRQGGGKGSLAYSTAKGAILTLTRGLARDLAPFGIRVNAVAPGLILGSRFHEIHTSKEAREETIKTIPLGRAGTCEDVARAVAYLASEYSGFITGATLDINGGVYMM